MSIIKIQEILNYNNLNFGPIGSVMPIAVDISSDDCIISTNIRLITCASGTVIKIDMLCTDGEATGVLLPVMGGAIPIINVTKIYKTGTDATGIYIWPLELGV